MAKYAALRSQLGIVPAGAGIPGYIKRALVYLLAFNVADSIYPNKIGKQDRVAAGGVVYPGRALAFDGVDQIAYVADNGDLDINQASTDYCFSAFVKTGSDLSTTQYLFGKPIAASIDGRFGVYIGSNTMTAIVQNGTSTYSVIIYCGFLFSRESSQLCSHPSCHW